ncbi:hypothetical protein BU16DRAFT_544859 [Lophium mytilinum]|uniref:Uncharacterized protein n=1 Tax=Lophium mytilinum TaxID=390894 RepID=A0A6A6QCT8_9PEZI|nr:hypothetical protein BU16DRAFT_544859 [Lophium mytilinum]
MQARQQDRSRQRRARAMQIRGHNRWCLPSLRRGDGGVEVIYRSTTTAAPSGHFSQFLALPHVRARFQTRAPLAKRQHPIPHPSLEAPRALPAASESSSQAAGPRGQGQASAVTLHPVANLQKRLYGQCGISPRSSSPPPVHAVPGPRPPPCLDRTCQDYGDDEACSIAANSHGIPERWALYPVAASRCGRATAAAWLTGRREWGSPFWGRENKSGFWGKAVRRPRVGV